jgi:hypothetical protein
MALTAPGLCLFCIQPMQNKNITLNDRNTLLPRDVCHPRVSAWNPPFNASSPAGTEASWLDSPNRSGDFTGKTAHKTKFPYRKPLDWAYSFIKEKFPYSKYYILYY